MELFHQSFVYQYLQFETITHKFDNQKNHFFKFENLAPFFSVSAHFYHVMLCYHIICCHHVYVCHTPVLCQNC